MATTSATVLVAVAVAGCGSSSGPTSAPSTSATSTRASSPGSASLSHRASTTASSAGNSDQIVAKIAAGAPPEDLTWAIASAPSNWKALSGQGAGEHQWQVSSGCGVLLQQPSGIGTTTKVTSKSVVEHTAEQIKTVMPGTPEPTYTKWSTRMMPNVVPGLAGTAKVRMEEAAVRFGAVRAQIIGYRNGDFALTYVAYCSTSAKFDAAAKSDFDPFLKRLAAKTTY